MKDGFVKAVETARHYGMVLFCGKFVDQIQESLMRPLIKTGIVLQQFRYNHT
jgi:hypothetical protein